MIRGYFGSDGWPYLLGIVSLPRLSIRASVVFLVDTGADVTALAPRDSLRMGVDFERHFPTGPSGVLEGIGGSAQTYSEEAQIQFLSEDGDLETFARPLTLLAGTHFMAMPSLLGRDLFDNYRISYCRQLDELTLESFDLEESE
ncbi:MAG: hypothetical protein WEB00_09755 [Dehalococcoidia bacterium]